MRLTSVYLEASANAGQGLGSVQIPFDCLLVGFETELKFASAPAVGTESASGILSLVLPPSNVLLQIASRSPQGILSYSSIYASAENYMVLKSAVLPLTELKARQSLYCTCYVPSADTLYYTCVVWLIA